MNNTLFRLCSAAFENEYPIPVKYTCDGESVSPASELGPRP